LHGLTVLRTHCLEISSLPKDLHVRPAVGLELLTHLILGDRLIPGNENRALARFRRDHSDANYSQQQQATACKYPSSIHRCSPLARASARPTLATLDRSFR